MVSLTTESISETASTEVGRLAVEIENALKFNPITQLRHVMCEVHGDVIVIRGQVDSYYLKQLAQETVRKQTPRAMIANLITVQ